MAVMKHMLFGKNSAHPTKPFAQNIVNQVKLNGSLLSSRVKEDERKIITNVFVWDGTLQPRKKLEILSVGNLIGDIQETNKIPRINGDLIIDGKGMTVMPGLVEGHSHITFPDSWDFDIPPEEHTLLSMHGAKKLLDAGFTSAFSAASAKIRLDIVIRNQINSGHIPGPRLRAAGPELTSPGGLGDGVVKGLHESNTFGYPCNGPEEVKKACQIIIQQGVDTLKVNISGEEYTSDGNDIKSTFTDEEVAIVVAACRAAGIKSAAHCRGCESVQIALRHGIDVLYHCEYADEPTLQLLAAARKKIFLGPALGLLVRGGNDAKNEPDKKAYVAAKTYKRLHEIAPDIRIVAGGDYGFPQTPQGENAFDLQVFVEWLGYSPLESLVAGTATGGELMGMPVGKIKKGYFADMLLVEGDPTNDVKILQDKEKIKMIIQESFIYKDTIQ